LVNVAVARWPHSKHVIILSEISITEEPFGIIQEDGDVTLFLVAFAPGDFPGRQFLR